MKKHAFTLAEVLITLGIIGIVAAMTIPSVIKKHRNQVVVSRLQKASSTLAQAHARAFADFGTNEREPFEPNNPDAALEMFDKYYRPYLKLSDVKKGQRGVYAYLSDGTGLYFFRNYGKPNSTGWENTYFIVCLTHKACEQTPETYSELLKSLGKERFTLYVNGWIPTYQLSVNSRNHLLKECKEHTGVESCSAIIGSDGWIIKDDYPHKL